MTVAEDRQNVLLNNLSPESHRLLSGLLVAMGCRIIDAGDLKMGENSEPLSRLPVLLFLGSGTGGWPSCPPERFGRHLEREWFHLILTVEDEHCGPIPSSLLEDAEDLFFLPESLNGQWLRLRLETVLNRVRRIRRKAVAPGQVHAQDSRKLACFIDHLKQEMQQRKLAEEQLRQLARVRKQMVQELQKKNREIHEANIGLRILIEQHKRTREEVETSVLHTLQHGVDPYLELLRKAVGGNEQALVYLELLQSNLANVSSTFARRLQSPHLGLSAREIQVADLVRRGMTNKEIAGVLHLTPGTVESYRNSLRRKLGLRGRKINLRTYLRSTFEDEATPSSES